MLGTTEFESQFRKSFNSHNVTILDYDVTNLDYDVTILDYNVKYKCNVTTLWKEKIPFTS